MLEEGQLIKKLKLGGVNHDKIRKWVKTVHARKHVSPGELPTTKDTDTTQSPPLKFDQSQGRHIIINQIGNLDKIWEYTPHNTQPIPNGEGGEGSTDTCARSCKVTIKVSLSLYSTCL
jgi:hypothetical protein